MNKAYNKITWQNKPSTATPLNQTNLNEMSNALDTIDDRVIALDSGKVGSVTVTNTLQAGDTIATITVDGTATNIKSAQVEVDAEPSATSENPLQNKAIYEMLNNLLPEETVQGNPIAISDASGLNAKACSVDLLPIQDLHGYDNPWIGGAGKNKLQNNGTSKTENGVTFTVNSDGSVTIKTESGGATNNTNFLIGAFIGINGTQYTINGIPSGLSSINMTAGNLGATDTGSGSTFTYDSTKTDKNVRIWCLTGFTATTPITVKPMIRLATVTDGTFAPYENICPISGRTEVSVTRTGKNLFDKTELKDQSGWNTITLNLQPNTSYTMSSNISQADASELLLYFFKNEGSLGQVYSGHSVTITTDSGGIAKVQQRRASGTKSYQDYEWQLELGSTATAYEPYQGETTEITLPQTVYEGKVNVTDGGTDSTYGMIDLGTLTWARNEQYNVMYAYISGKKPGRENIQSSQYKTVDKTYPFLLDGECTGTFDTGINIKDDRYTDPTAFKTAMSGVQLLYELATPEELTTSAKQISLLKGINVLSTDGDNIILKYSADIKAWVENQLQS